MPKEKIRQWKVSSQTAYRLDIMNLVSGVEKNKLVDSAVAVFFATVLELEKQIDKSSAATIRTIVNMIPADPPINLSENRIPDEVMESLKEVFKLIYGEENSRIIAENVKKLQNSKEKCENNTENKETDNS